MLVTNAGEMALLSAGVGKTAASSWTLRLFSNNKTPAVGDVAANYTEVVGGGYAAIPLVAANWVTVTGATTTYPEQTFTFTGPTNAPGTIYGAYIDMGGGNIIGAERLAVVFTPGASGDTVKVTPSFAL